MTGNNQLGTAGVATNMTVVVSGTAGSGHGGSLQLSGNVNYNLPITIGRAGLNGVSLTPPGSMGALDNEGGDNTWGGTVTLAGLGSSGTDPRQNQIEQGGTLRLTGVVQSEIGLNTGFNKTGSGDVVLSGARS